MIRRTIRSIPRGAGRRPPSKPLVDPYGLGIPPGGEHHRAYVGPPADYDLIAGLSFGVLFASGLRETHQVLDVGCGSLRVGRLLIPYLRREHYCGIEPNRHLVETAIQSETGKDLINLKKPRFSDNSDFSGRVFANAFDRVLAQSIFSHTYPDLTRVGLQAIEEVLSPTGLLVGTYYPGESRGDGSGWLYPSCTKYGWDEFNGLLMASGLYGSEISWPHPRQQWFVAGRPSLADHIRRVVETIRLGMVDGANAS